MDVSEIKIIIFKWKYLKYLIWVCDWDTLTSNRGAKYFIVWSVGIAALQHKKIIVKYFWKVGYTIFSTVCHMTIFNKWSIFRGKNVCNNTYTMA